MEKSLVSRAADTRAFLYTVGRGWGRGACRSFSVCARPVWEPLGGGRGCLYQAKVGGVVEPMLYGFTSCFELLVVFVWE